MLIDLNEAPLATHFTSVMRHILGYLKIERNAGTFYPLGINWRATSSHYKAKMGLDGLRG